MVTTSNTKRGRSNNKKAVHCSSESSLKITRGTKDIFTKNDIPLSKEERKHLKKQKVSEDDPGYYLSWNINEVQRIINDLQTGAFNPGVPAPPWLQLNSSQAFIDSIMQHLANAGGGVVAGQLIAPNTLPQSYRIEGRLRSLEVHPFFQALGATMNGAHLAVAAYIRDKVQVSAELINRDPPEPPLIALFP